MERRATDHERIQGKFSEVVYKNLYHWLSNSMIYDGEAKTDALKSFINSEAVIANLSVNNYNGRIATIVSVAENDRMGITIPSLDNKRISVKKSNLFLLSRCTVCLKGTPFPVDNDHCPYCYADQDEIRQMSIQLAKPAQ